MVGSGPWAGNTKIWPGKIRFGSPGGASRSRLASIIWRQYGATSAEVGARPHDVARCCSARRQKSSPPR
ncbi:MAG TPA: hypothetical protein VFZ68_01840, partial [Acidimicrobiales bacterium]